MTPQAIIAKLFLPIDAERVKKTQGLAQRHKIEWSDVLAAMTEDQRKAVQDAQVSGSETQARVSE